ncbi:ParB/Sulfiredoxin [uncultured Caudovirales phage]|uniref:ParB/Sulfiredoxin n=1 Tax=uncultured Caudovirales phage TaxID=2100421 RepID=A0A6J5LAT8_9CAUD|nr:ParB/Sulfiredoxin [uncultured Caudovirales phage]
MAKTKPKTLAITYRSVDDLIPFAKNSRTHSDEQVLQIAASIREFGFTNPVLVDEEDGIIAGHGRVMAARRLKLKEVPTILLAGLTESQKRAYVIADNKLALNAGWDEELLAVELGDLRAGGFDIGLTGFDVAEIEKMLGKLGTPDAGGGADESENYAAQFAVIVTCKDEANQEEVFNKLSDLGFNCKVVNT